MQKRADDEDDRVVEKRPDEPDIDVDRDVVGFGYFHRLRAACLADMTYPN
jgi:hypothetical protein